MEVNMNSVIVPEGKSSDRIYFFPWQNPVLRKSIFPHREIKLRDFLLIYKEAELWASLRNKDINDPVIRNRLSELEARVHQERERITKALGESIQRRLQSDQWFARISGRDDKNLRFKRLYYLGRMINDNTSRLADLESRQRSFLRKLDWYQEGDSRRKTWEGRAQELDAPILAVRQELDELTTLRGLFDQESRLPPVESKSKPTITDLARAELSEYQDQLNRLNHDELVEKVWERLGEKRPDGSPRFEKWFAYMVIHFSGMRYMSAHGSWADPNDLLELLVREDLKGKLAPGEDIDDRAEAEIQRLLNLPVNTTNRHLNPTLRALIHYKEQKDRKGEPIPDWVWGEIVKFTQLRLGATDENWEAVNPERWNFENRRWREVMSTWQRADITGWRNAHHQTLDLIVTRAVCNEIAEHIQHLRGNTPVGGLTAKPKWYLRLQAQTQALPESDPKKCFFRQANDSNDFRNGSSVLWLGWVDKEPNAWQVAEPLPGIDLWPGTNLLGNKSGTASSGGVPAKISHIEAWTYSRSGPAFIRTRKMNVDIPSVQELRKRGMTDREIEQYRIELRKKNTVEKEYLRWKHEAITVDVVELIEGTHVLTFETGKIGLNWHHLGSLVRNGYDQVFVGYLPKSNREPENLQKLLDVQKVLHRFAGEAVEVEAIPATPLPRELTGLTLTQPLSGAETLGAASEETAIPVQQYYVYFITNRLRKTIFLGMTLDMKTRAYEHKNKLLPGLQKRASLNRLVFYQAYECLADAQAVFRIFDNFTHNEKVDFIIANNPGWRDLSDEL
jgi:putative endonuclease